MFTIQAPHPSLQATTVLPNPEFSDSEALSDQVTVKRAINGTRYSYVKRRGGRRKLQWSFQLTRNKGLELRAFLQSYFASPIRLVDHHGRIWVGHFTNNPFEFEGAGRAGPAIHPMPRGENYTITLEFEGVEDA